MVFTKKDWQEQSENLKSEILNLNWPVFVKPVHLGSSIGIGKAKNKDIKDLEFKVEVALHYDNKVSIEEGVEDVMDVTCCVIGNETLIASQLQESVFSKDLFDFEAKYIEEGGAQTGNAQSSLVIPARLDAETTTAIQEAAKNVYKALGCSGIARIDFLYGKQSKKFYANEVNPMPGTVYHHLWKASGIDLPELLEKLLTYASESYQEKRQINLTFESSILKQLNGTKMGGKKLSGQ